MEFSCMYVIVPWALLGLLCHGWKFPVMRRTAPPMPYAVELPISVLMCVVLAPVALASCIADDDIAWHHWRPF